jgi:uncharacterized protein YegL
MCGERIDKLNDAIAALPSEVSADPLAAKRIELAIVGFPPVRAVQDFVGVGDFVPPRLQATGSTPLGAAVWHGLKIIEERKQFYRRQHLDYYRPWLFLITDGEPDVGDDWRGAAEATRHAESQNKVTFFSVGVPGADMGVLRQFSRRPPVTLTDLKFREMFIWLSRSLTAVSRSNTHSGGTKDAKVKVEGELDWGEF